MDISWLRAIKNTTRKYNPDCSHRDKWAYLDWNWRVLSRHIKYDYDDEGGYAKTYRIKTNKSVPREELRAVMRDAFIKGCSCEHDCCGHYFGGLLDIDRPDNRKKNEYLVHTSYSPNY